MVDRRRAVRYSFCASRPAALTLVRDAALEFFDGTRASLVTSEAAAPGDELVVVFRRDGAAPVCCLMRVRSSTPACLEQSAAYRLELSFVGPSANPDVA